MTRLIHTEAEFSRPGQFAFVRLSVERAARFRFQTQARCPFDISIDRAAAIANAVKLGVESEVERWRAFADVNVAVSLLEIRYDPATSSEMTFKLAAQQAMGKYFGKIWVGPRPPEPSR